MNKIPRRELQRLKKMSVFEEELRAQGYKIIAGVDEAGRGPLAGPVVAAACILPDGFLLEKLNDSKQLTAIERQKLYHKLTQDPKVLFGIGIVDAKIIDEVNILQATLQAMEIAISKLVISPEFLLIDGKQCPKSSIPSKGIVDGDALSLSIAAASVIAKVVRDDMMEEFHKKWPKYGFNRHKGYPTEDHRKALELFGPCPIHRLSFGSVKNNFTNAV